MVNAANFPLILQCRQRHHRFGARARPSAVSGHHPRRHRCRRVAASVVLVARCGALGPSSPARRRILAADPIATNKPSTSAASDRPLPHTAPHKLLAQVEHPAGRSRMLVAVHGLAVRSASDAIRAPLTAVVETGCAVARHPVARIAPPAPAIISASRARVGERNGKRGEFSADPSVPPAPPPFRGTSETERSQRPPSHDDTDVAGWRRVSCWSHRGCVGTIIAGAAPNPRRRSDRHQQTIDVGRQPPSIATHSAAQAAGAGRAPRRSISHARRCPRARRPLSERCHKSPPHRSC